MAPTPPDPNAPTPPGGWQSMLSRLRGMVQGAKPPDQDRPATAAASEPVPVAQPVGGPPPAGTPVAAQVTEPAPTASAPSADGTPPPADGAGSTCPFCQAPRAGAQTHCDNCGLVFPPAADADPASAVSATLTVRVRGRYQLVQLLAHRGDVRRYRARDHGAGGAEPADVVVVRRTLPPPAADAAPAAPAEDDDLLPTLDEPDLASYPLTEPLPPRAAWPSPAWEQALLEQAGQPALPAVRDAFVEDGCEYLVEELPAGRPFWDAWDDPSVTAAERFGWLRQIALALAGLHAGGAIVEALRPDILVVAADGTARLADLSELLPLPLPEGVPLKGSPCTAPELIAAPADADVHADLYGFGALLYALYLGRELTELDFDGPGVPKPILARFPDIHPLLYRLLNKTLCREPRGRFPTDEAGRQDPTGFAELIRTLDVCGQGLDQVRLDVAAWTTTGIVRTGNEDTFAFLHAAEARQDELAESALVLLADGMGGYEAGEVAAALAVQVLRGYLLGQPSFALLGGATAAAQTPFDLDVCQRLLAEGLREANRQVFTAARSGTGRRGMGCTAEAVYVNGRYVVVGHVGDSRTYHLHEGRLVQLTRDHTLVNRLVELGTLTPEEAETHPRRSELQQAIGGHATVEPALYFARLQPGDWVVVCSDGLSNHVTARELQEMLLSEATSAEMAARRLVNFANAKGANDNATVVVVRAT